MQTVTWPRSSRSGKMLVPLLGVLAVMATGVAAVAIVLKIQESDKLRMKARELEMARTENADLKGQLEDIQRIKSRIEQELVSARKELAASRDELAQTVKAQETLTRSIEDREQEITRLTNELQQAQQQSLDVSGQLATLQGERDGMRQQLADVEQAKGDLEAKIMELSGQPSVQLGKVLVTEVPASAGDSGVMPISIASPSLQSDGQVVVVNREYDFIVMNMGKNHGLTVGQEFQVTRGGEVLGKVKVEKVYDELSAAAILPESKKNSIREGDLVKAL